ncbi:hypothetical protein Tco_1096666 [Tanacetum coccineum]
MRNVTKEASVEDEHEEEEEEEHLAPTDSIAVAFPVVDPVPFAEETKPFETDEFAATPPPLPLSSPLPLPPPIILPRTRASMVLMRAAVPSTYILAPRSGTLPLGTPPSGTPPLLPIPLPT